MSTLKRFFAVGGLVSLFFMYPLGILKSQISVPGEPFSFSIKTKQAVAIPRKLLSVIDTASLTREDRIRKIENRYSVVEEVTVNIRNEGVRTEIAGKGTIWRYQLSASQCFSLGLWFEVFHLPDRASLFIYNQAHTQILGAFTGINNNPARQLAIAEFKGSHAIVEYFEPFNSAFEGELVIGYVSQAYKDIFEVFAAQARIGINCPEGANWQDQKHSVCRMTFKAGNSGYYCTGYLVNNVTLDGTPYFMTANHCISTSTVASTLVTYFNYENSTCSGTDASLLQTLSGATLKSTNEVSDFTLLLLNKPPPKDYLAYLAGWDATGLIPQNATGIHHPSGTPKCISLDNNPLVSYSGRITWDNNYSSLPNTHWQVKFDAGDTESGSSGSPIFDENKRVVGQLHGGNETDSYYGKFNVSWDYSVIFAAQLKKWLDPNNTGQTSMDGMYLSVKPKAQFSVANARACLNDNVLLKDESTNAPKFWRWKISPSSFRYVNGTTATTQFPEVVFEKTGNYSFELVAQNDYGVDSVAKTDFISVVDKIQVSLAGIPADGIICGCDLIKFPIVAKGAPVYSFSLQRDDKIDFTAGNDTLYLSLKSKEKKYGTFESYVKVQGALGRCVATDSVKLKISMPSNDLIANAAMLWPGDNGSFSNFCGSVEPNEPAPPLNSCTGNKGWCPAGSDMVLNHSVWYTFFGPSNGLITIDTRNINSRIAVYEAESYEDIISGNRATYTLLAANDNRSATETGALIENLEVIPGKKYWLQVDGANGVTGDISIKLLSNSLEVFPNPTRGTFDVILSSFNEGRAEVKIYSATGRLVLDKTFQVTALSNRFQFDMTSFTDGVYVMHVNLGGEITKKKLILMK